MMPALTPALRARLVQCPQLVGELIHRTVHRDPRCDLLDRQRRDGRGGSVDLREPAEQLVGRTGVHDAAETHPRMGRRAHRAVLARGVDRRRGTLLRREVLGRPARDRELRVLRRVARCHPVVVGEELHTLGVDQCRAERLVACLQRGVRKVHGAAQTLEIPGGDNHAATIPIGASIYGERVSAEPRWSAVVFDLDGTLVDTVPLIVASYQHTFRTHLGREEDEALIRSWIGQPLIRSFREVDPAQAEAMCETYLRWNHDRAESMIRSFDGASDLLRDLEAAGVRVGVATSKPRVEAGRAIAFTGLDGLVDLTVALEDTETHKPDPTPIALACHRIGAEPGHSAYVGDAAVDVLAGRAAGADTVAVAWGAGTPEALTAVDPTVEVATFGELRATLLP